MTCSKTYNYSGNIDKLVSDLKQAVESSGGTFNGDSTSGEAYGSNPVDYHLKYSYNSSVKDLTITILEKPFYVSCEKALEAIEDYLQNYDPIVILRLLEK